MPHYQFRPALGPFEVLSSRPAAWFSTVVRWPRVATKLFARSEPEVQLTVYLRLERATEGNFVCTAYALDEEHGGPLNGREADPSRVTEVIDDLLDQARAAGDAAFRVGQLEPTPSVPRVERPRRGGRGPSSEELQLFVVTYRTALENAGRSRALAAAAEAADVSIATAHRWRDRAESEGLLEPRDDETRLTDEATREMERRVRISDTILPQVPVVGEADGAGWILRRSLDGDEERSDGD